MTSIPVRELIPVLQAAIGPVILISGVGLVLLTLTNRFGRAVDRARVLTRELRTVSDSERKRLEGQVNILYHRARLIQIAIFSAAGCVLLVSVLIIVLFLTVLLHLETGFLASLLFIGCLSCLVIALCAFIKEIHLSLHALRLELGKEKV